MMDIDSPVNIRLKCLKLLCFFDFECKELTI